MKLKDLEEIFKQVFCARRALKYCEDNGIFAITLFFQHTFNHETETDARSKYD